MCPLQCESQEHGFPSSQVQLLQEHSAVPLHFPSHLCSSANAGDEEQHVANAASENNDLVNKFIRPLNNNVIC